MRTSLLVPAIVVAVLGAGAALTPRSSRAAAAQGDPLAKSEVVAAFDRLNSVTSYRTKTSASGGTTMIEVVRPDKRHVTAQSPNGTFESITIGTQTRERVNMPGRPAGWRCTTNRRPLATIFSLERMRKDLTEVVRKPDAVIDGMPVHTYADASGRGATLYIGVSTGLPRRLVGVDQQSGKTATVDFYDYGAPITITLPACG
jgi:hypothetical protein